MPFLLYTYLATEILAPFFASLIILNAILFLGRLIPLLKIIFDFGISASDFIRLCCYIAPKLLLFSIPMASMMGVIVAFTRMANDNEVMALKASGIGLYRMLPPVVLVAFCTAAITGLTATSLIPKGTVAMKKLFYQLAKEKIDRGVQAKQFSEGIKNVVLYVDQIDPQTQKWNGVYVSDLRHEKNPVTIIAQTGALTADLEEMRITLHLTDGSLNRAIADKTQTMRFQQYTLNLPVQPPTSIAGDSPSKIGKSGMTQQQLLDTAARLDPQNAERHSLLIEYHQRLALPVGCFILTILGLPLTMLGRPTHRSQGVPLGLLVFIFYYVLLTAAKAFAEDGSAPVALAMWLPNSVFAALTVLFTRRVAQERSGAAVERLLDVGQGILSRLPRRKRKERR